MTRSSNCELERKETVIEEYQANNNVASRKALHILPEIDQSRGCNPISNAVHFICEKYCDRVIFRRV